MSNILVEFITAKSGAQTLKVNDYFVHSKYDPQREAKQLSEMHYTPHHAHVVFGYGCGYLVDALLEQFKYNEVLIVVDPLFNDNSINVRKEHDGFNIYNGISLKDFEFILGDLAKEARVAYKTMCLPNYDKLFPEEYKLMLTKIHEVQFRHLVNDYTLIRYAKDWHVNFMKNLSNLAYDYSIEHLNQAYNCPIVIASGGPSLNKQIEQLKKIRNNVLLIAAGSTVNSLVAVDLEPDYVVSIDGGNPNFQHFRNLRVENAQLIYTMQSHPGVRKSFLNDCYIIGITGFESTTNYMKEQLNIYFPEFISGGTVAHLAFSVAQYISSGPIALIGQDLAYTDNLTHAANNKFARPIDEAFIKQMEAFQTEGYDGQPIWTTKPFYSMKLEFEELVKVKHPKVPFFNCTEGGLTIKGFEQIPFKEFCKRFVTAEKVKKIAVTEKDKIEIDVQAVLNAELKNYERLLDLFTDGLKTLRKNVTTTKFEQSILKRLDKIDQKVADILVKSSLDSVLAPIRMQIMRGFLEKENETPEESYNRVYEQTKTLYEKLKEAVTFAKTVAEEVLEELKENEGLTCQNK